MTDLTARIPPALYTEIRDWLLINDPDGRENYEWAQGVEPPADAAHLAANIIWIILCAGRSAQAARTLEKRIWDALRAGRPAVEAFGYRAKAAAIDRAWRDRGSDCQTTSGMGPLATRGKGPRFSSSVTSACNPW